MWKQPAMKPARRMRAPSRPCRSALVVSTILRTVTAPARETISCPESSAQSAACPCMACVTTVSSDCSCFACSVLTTPSLPPSEPGRGAIFRERVLAGLEEASLATADGTALPVVRTPRALPDLLLGRLPDTSWEPTRLGFACPPSVRCDCRAPLNSAREITPSWLRSRVSKRVSTAGCAGDRPPGAPLLRLRGRPCALICCRLSSMRKRAEDSERPSAKERPSERRPCHDCGIPPRGSGAPRVRNATGAGAGHHG
mmetsp:Transcript_17587/g.45323  ORF Transcript_17587/g.45323 Transcript_17587/m.45323 type:complete len:256 (-) Transcript_17587:33-800(-)